MSEKPENRAVSEQKLEQAAGGRGEDGIRTYVFCCAKCHAYKQIRSAIYPTEGLTCCGMRMILVSTKT